MFRLMKNEWNKLKVPVIATIVLLTIAAIILSCTLYMSYSLYTDLDAWEIGREILDFLFPLFVVTPICWLMYYERRNNYLIYTLPRIGKFRYLTAKWLTSALCAVAILFIPYFLSAVFALYVKPPITPYDEYLETFSHIFQNAYMQTPLLYALLLSIWKSVIGVMVMSLGFVLSLYVKNIFIILTGPFIYSILENFIWAILQLPQNRLVTSFEPTIVTTESITLISLSTGPALLLVFIALLWLYFAKAKRNSVYEV